MELKIEKLVYGGDGLSRLPADERGPGKTVFVPFSMDGEQVEAHIIEEKPGFARGRIERIVNASPDRVEPGCPYFLRCGGCQYQHASYAHQLSAKAAILLETIKRTAKIELPCELQIHSSPEWNYRNRTRLKVQAAPEFRVGYYKFRSHELLPVEQCPISSPLINRAIGEVWAAGQEGKVPEGIREIELFADHEDERLLVEVYCGPATARKDAEDLAAKLEQIFSRFSGVTVFQQPIPNQLAEPRRLAFVGSPELEYQTKFAGFRVSAGAFFQVNRFLIGELIDIVVTGKSGKLALDLYAGVGLFSAVLAKSFAQVIAVEASQTSHSDLRHNAPQEVKAVLATTEQYLEPAIGMRPDLVVVDPPRGGLGENVVRGLAKVASPSMTYVSCDPATLARDLRMLVGSGYRMVEAHLIDLFPQTFHIESVFHLAR
ncbi:MAG TPA: 23S rRNA (uracil(1939)-C(5))-methyltransferase RlmD [Terriglobales bacterium]|nr:23S rRNA (uracil(1939)-C(5))-methyltransferase RlmD [Terriglobales bacterium]